MPRRSVTTAQWSIKNRIGSTPDPSISDPRPLRIRVRTLHRFGSRVASASQRAHRATAFGCWFTEPALESSRLRNGSLKSEKTKPTLESPKSILRNNKICECSSRFPCCHDFVGTSDFKGDALFTEPANPRPTGRPQTSTHPGPTDSDRCRAQAPAARPSTASPRP